MVPACIEQDFQEEVPVGAPDKLIVKPGELRLFRSVDAFADESLVRLLIPCQPVLEVCFFRFGTAAYESPVGLVHLAVPEHCAEALQGLGCLGQYRDSAYRAVKSMRYAQEDISWLAVPRCDESFVFVSESLVSRLVSLDDISDFLVYYQNMIVFV